MPNIKEGKAFLSPGLNTNLERLIFCRAEQRKDQQTMQHFQGDLN